MYVDIGCQGRISDGGVFKNTQLNKNVEQNTLFIPEAKPLGMRKKIPYFFIGDDAFTLSEHLLKAFPGMHSKNSVERIFNYRLCRTRRVVENLFGIMSSIFRVLRQPILLEPEKASIIVLTIAHVHNFLRKSTNSRLLYTPHGTADYIVDGRIVDGSWRNAYNRDNMSSLMPLQNVPRRSCTTAKEVRDELAQYFQNEGRVEWQYHYA